MKRLSYLLLLLFLFGCSTSREIRNSITTFQIEFPDHESIDKTEKRFSSSEVIHTYGIGLSNEYFPGVKNFDFAQPKIYTRKNEDIKTVVSYFYTEKDKTVRLIEYSWDGLKNSDSIKEIYNKNELTMNAYFNKKGNLTTADVANYWQEELSWENEKIFVFQFILGDKSKNAYRTRLIIRRK